MTIELLDRYRLGISSEEVERIMLRGMTADVLVSSCNAITADGKLVNETAGETESQDLSSVRRKSFSWSE